jgi:NAD(P)-dependent dehydrogenase (short-subunit alcohol dehydrogenase family)
MELEKRVAIITGAGSGIGKAIALAFAAEGALVIVNDINKESAQKVVGEIERRNGIARYYICSVSQYSEVEKLVAFTLKEFGTVDILVNNVGWGSLFMIVDMPPDEWENNLKTTLSSNFNCSKAVVPIMTKKKYGKIISIASTAGIRMSTVAGVDYTAAKHGVLGLMHALAYELAEYGINVNAVNPGMTMTDRNKGYMSPDDIVELEDNIPMGHFCDPTDIANAVVFLASEKARMITGQSITVDGGWLLGLSGSYGKSMAKRKANSEKRINEINQKHKEEKD